MTTSLKEDGSYRIGAVSRLTGIPSDTLRIWERRYDIVEPSRTTKGARLYSQSDVSRLMMIKSLVDQGNAISTVASLSIKQLNERLSSSHQNNLPELGSGRHDVCVVGQALSIKAVNTDYMPTGLELAGTYTELDWFVDDETVCDTLIVECPTVERKLVKQIKNKEFRSRYKNLILVYAFAPTNLLNQLRRIGVVPIRAPVSIDHLWQLCVNKMPSNIDWKESTFEPSAVIASEVPERLFTRVQLARLSSITPLLKCECPQHLSTLIEQLVSFEDYSLDCENMSSKDEQMHAYLHVMTSKARSMLEIALSKLAEYEGIKVDKFK